MTEEKESKEQPEQPQEVKAEPEQSPGTKSTETTLTQTQVNKLLADERRKHEAKYKDLQTEYNGYKQTINSARKKRTTPPLKKLKPCERICPTQSQNSWINSRRLNNWNG